MGARLAALAGAAVLLAGCGNTAELVKALGTDAASVCLSARAMLYGSVIICRTNAASARTP